MVTGGGGNGHYVIIRAPQEKKLTKTYRSGESTNGKGRRTWGFKKSLERKKNGKIKKRI